MKNFVQPGNVVTLTAPAGGVSSGEGVLVGALFGVSAYAADENKDMEVSLVGVFDLPKATGGGLAEGAKAYWDTTAKKVTATASGNKLIGAAIRAAASNDTTARVRLDGSAI